MSVFTEDDVPPPWQPRSSVFEGDAELLNSGGERFGGGFAPEIMRLHPIKILARGIDGQRRQSQTVRRVEAGAS